MIVVIVAKLRRNLLFSMHRAFCTAMFCFHVYSAVLQATACAASASSLGLQSTYAASYHHSIASSFDFVYHFHSGCAQLQPGGKFVAARCSQWRIPKKL